MAHVAELTSYFGEGAAQTPPSSMSLGLAESLLVQLALEIVIQVDPENSVYFVQDRAESLT